MNGLEILNRSAVAIKIEWQYQRSYNINREGESTHGENERFYIRFQMGAEQRAFNAHRSHANGLE